MMEISSGNNQQSLMATLPLEEILISCQKSSQPPHQQPDSKKPRPNPEQALKCPRCDSTNTKFCYYNNYSLSQPRYFCKGCKRYWTKGGSLRNVPVGGGSRKNKKLSSNLNSSFLNKPLLENNPVFISDQPSYHRDLNLQLAFARLHGSGLMVGNPNPNPNYGYIDALYQNGFMHGFYGFGPQESQYQGQNFANGEVSSGIGDESANTTTIQGSPCKSFHGAERKDLVGLNQWQLGGDGLSIGTDFGRENFNAFASSNYHGLTNK